ncbi:helix-turn-helix transcriptional regulator [Caulobacter rhizosphaerae]|jgi:predicted DNA-binding transcriptional regulator YafY|uniref:helix-turn-helix transcriptional regulator n=1 Tax=Caulobacter rhizosphaerae TaxID=2010972 RepID=UPI0013D67D58|nr:YafY family protein [Caulobacter rhizosphaerae]GGL13408.1 DNA-binding protein [Caulobacter rhizosphaerae]
MSRSHRLFDLLQELRRRRGTVSGGALARELDVSLRTIRRDIATLQAMGADIDGEPGVGYILRPGFVLPPLSFTEEEIQALVVGAQWVSRQTDEALARAVQNALAKIHGVLSPDMRRALDDSALFVSRSQAAASGVDLARVRRALREQWKMRITYADEDDTPMDRTLWPIMLGFIENQRFIAGWCELTSDFRLFRTDRILKVDFLEERYARNRRQLVKEWRARDEHPCRRTDCS